MPKPCGLVVQKASKIWSRLFGSSPGPESSTETSTPRESSVPDRTNNSRGPAPGPLIASMAFIIRLRITCCNWTRSAKMSGTSRELSPYHYTVSLYFAVRQRNDFLDRLVSVEVVFSRRRFLSQRADSADDFDG